MREGWYIVLQIKKLKKQNKLIKTQYILDDESILKSTQQYSDSRNIMFKLTLLLISVIEHCC